MEVLKAHGSRNDILVVEGDPVGADLVGWLCDRAGPLGGADGVYFVDDSVGDSVDEQASPARAWFFNPDGSASSFCGNGMRCVGRLLLERHQRDAVQVRSGTHQFTVRRAEPTPEQVAQTVVELPPVTFGDIDAHHLELSQARRFTALAVPNPHLVSLVDRYDEAELVEVGRAVAANPTAYPDGANVSYVLPLADGEVFVRTYERGAGLTLSCGSGVAAVRAVLSRLGQFPPDAPVVVRNPGGVIRAWLAEQDGSWCPRIEGNATFEFRATVDLARRTAGEPDRTGEDARFVALSGANHDVLWSQGVKFHPAGVR